MMKTILITLVLCIGVISCNEEKKLQKQIDKSQLLMIQHPDKFGSVIATLFPNKITETIPGKVTTDTVFRYDTTKDISFVHDSSKTFYPVSGPTLIREIYHNRVDTFFKNDDIGKAIASSQLNKALDDINNNTAKNTSLEKSKSFWLRFAWIGILIALVAGFILGKIF